MAFEAVRQARQHMHSGAEWFSGLERRHEHKPQWPRATGLAAPRPLSLGHPPARELDASWPDAPTGAVCCAAHDPGICAPLARGIRAQAKLARSVANRASHGRGPPCSAPRGALGPLDDREAQVLHARRIVGLHDGEDADLDIVDGRAARSTPESAAPAAVSSRSLADRRWSRLHEQDLLREIRRQDEQVHDLGNPHYGQFCELGELHLGADHARVEERLELVVQGRHVVAMGIDGELLAAPAQGAQAAPYAQERGVRGRSPLPAASSVTW
jgi:hypothetical protein